MNYLEDELNTLWDLLKNRRQKFNELNLGLKEVNFNIPFTNFEKKYKEAIKAHNVELAEVKQNIGDVIKILANEDNYVVFHHISCVTPAIYGDNAALCIHYEKTDLNMVCSVAIPGINYIPTKETLNKYARLEDCVNL